MRYLVGYARMKIERRARWDRFWKPVDWLCQKIEDIYWAAREYELIECLGDSHIAAFRRINFTYPEIKYRFRTTSVLSATAYGVGKPQSSTNVRKIFEKKLSELEGKVRVMVCLGENDTSFLIWFLAQQKNIQIERVLSETLIRYQKFLILAKSKVRELIVCSSPLPSIKDGQKNPEVALLRDSIDVSWSERTLMALKFNGEMRVFCENNNIAFLDLDGAAIDPQTGLLAERFIRQDKYDNHYIEDEYIKIIVPRLEALPVVGEARKKGNDG